MPDTLLLDSLQVRGFRAFRDLQIPHLGVVNLIVGKNNVGKSSLLEALRLYAENGSPSLIRELLVTRQESREVIHSSQVFSASEFDDEDEPFQSIKYLFYGRPDIIDHLKPILIGPINSSSKTLSILVEIYEGLDRNRDRNLDQPTLPLMDLPDAIVEIPYSTVTLPFLVVQGANYAAKRYRLDPFFRFGLRTASRDTSQVFIGANGLDTRRIGDLWNEMATAGLEDAVLSALQIIAPEVQRISLRVDQRGRREHIPIVKIAEAARLIPLRSMGDGMVRMFGIALALVSARNGMLLIDEIESGLHYSVQADMWRLIFGAAQRFNIQVFATTHSLDCIRGFRKAAIEDTQTEGVLIRLQRKRDDITATAFNEEEVAIATSNGIEVR